MENIDIRLDQYLTQKFPAYSRSFLKSQIQQGNVLVSGKIKKPSYILKPTDKIEANIATPAKSILQPNPNIKLKIIYEDENIIAIDKPAEISTHPVKRIYEINPLRGSRVIRPEANFTRHPTKPNQTNTIANALLSHYPPIKNVGDPSTCASPEASARRASSGQVNLRPGIVHRLDKDTSGMMIVAKNQKTFDWLKKQFSERKIVKKYTALVYGKLKDKKGVIAKSIGKTKDFRKRTTIPLKEQKEAITCYRTIKELGGYSLVEAEPKTGRTHQIRVHFASIGHPVVSDKLYSFKNQTPPKNLKRQFLHASCLKFSLPSGSIIELKSDLPDDLKQCLQNLTSSIKNN